MDVVVKGTKYDGMVMLAGKSDGWMDAWFYEKYH